MPPSAWIAIAVSAAATCSPVAAMASISRASGTAETWCASPRRRFVSPLIALTMTTTSLPSALGGEAAPRDVPDALERTDGGSAVFLDDESHEVAWK